MGCTASSEPVEVVDFAEKCRSPDLRFTEETLSLDGGERNMAAWLPLSDEEVRGVVCVSHGLGEHALCYHHVARALVQKGYAVYALDHVAHGRSAGRRGVVPDDRIVRDFVQFVLLARERHGGAAPALPLALVAHSMGTLVALNALPALRERDVRVAALVLSGTALVSGPSAASPFGVRALYPLSQTSAAAGLTAAMAAVAPGAPAAPIAVDEITSNAAVRAEMARDPRRNAPVVTNRTARVLLDLMRTARESVAAVDAPLLLLHGADDTLTLPAGSEFVFANAATAASEKRLLVLPQCKHEVFNETAPRGDDAVAAAVQFVDEYCAMSLSVSVSVSLSVADETTADSLAETAVEREKETEGETEKETERETEGAAVAAEQVALDVAPAETERETEKETERETERETDGAGESVTDETQ